MRGMTSWGLLAAALVLAGCRSPFGSTPEDPEAGRVGRGVHGWPAYESAPHGSGWRTDVLWPGFSTIDAEEGELSRTQVLIPVFLFESEGEPASADHRRRVGFLRPLWDLETQGDDVYDLDVLWPVFKYEDTPHTQERRVFPIYFSAEKDDAGYWHLWPFYGRDWSATREQQWVLTPFLSHTTDPENDVSTWDLPWPLVCFGHEGDERHVRVLPILWHDEDGEDHHTVVFPFIWDIEDHGTSFEMAFPLYAKFRENNGDYADAILPPLYVRGQDGDEEYTWLVAPLVRWGESPDAWSAHLFPILWLERQDDGDGYTHLWPLFGWEQHGDEREAGVIWPFFRYEWDADGWETDLPWPLVHFEQRSKRSETRVWPLFCDEKRTTTNDGVDTQHREGNVLLVLSNWESEGDDDYDFRILWKLVRSAHEAGKDTFVLNPLFRHETNEAGDSYWSFLFGLVARKQEQGAVDWRFLWFL